MREKHATLPPLTAGAAELELTYRIGMLESTMDEQKLRADAQSTGYERKTRRIQGRGPEGTSPSFMRPIP